MENKKMGKKLKIVAGVVFGLYALFTISSLFSTPKNSGSSTDFAQSARSRFDSLKTSIPELKEIRCVDDVCDSVAYFNFKKLPDDFEFIIRGNAATFSKFRLDNTGGSHVTIIGQLNGSDVLTCHASDGKVDDCK